MYQLYMVVPFLFGLVSILAALPFAIRSRVYTLDARVSSSSVSVLPIEVTYSTALSIRLASFSISFEGVREASLTLMENPS